MRKTWSVPVHSHAIHSLCSGNADSLLHAFSSLKYLWRMYGKIRLALIPQRYEKPSKDVSVDTIAFEAFFKSDKLLVNEIWVSFLRYVCVCVFFTNIKTEEFCLRYVAEGTNQRRVCVTSPRNAKRKRAKWNADSFLWGGESWISRFQSCCFLAFTSSFYVMIILTLKNVWTILLTEVWIFCSTNTCITFFLSSHVEQLYACIGRRIIFIWRMFLIPRVD